MKIFVLVFIVSVVIGGPVIPRFDRDDRGIDVYFHPRACVTRLPMALDMDTGYLGIKPLPQPTGGAAVPNENVF